MASKEPKNPLQKIPESSSNGSSKSKDSKELAEAALKDIEEQLQKGKDQHEKAVQKWQTVVNIPSEGLKEPTETLKVVIEKKLPQEVHAEKPVTRSENLSDCEILTWASGGLALQGIYQTSDITDLLGKREQLIQIPKGFKLCGPIQPSCLEKMEFSSSKEESTFRKTVEHLGLSFSLVCKAEFKRFFTGIHSSYSRTSESAKTFKSSSEHADICTVQYNYIPLALCHFPRNQLKLSSSALQELRETEHLLRHSSESDKANVLKSRCGSFFKRFGSHVNCNVHFGGIFWWRASSEGFKTNQAEERKKQTQNALSAQITGCCSGQGGGMDFGRFKTDASAEGTDKKLSQTEIELSVYKMGGPPEVDSLIPWKSGLLASNKTWSVIDRGDEFIPVWDIALSNHKEDFEDVLDISNCLRESYEGLSGRKVIRMYGEELIGVEKKITVFLEGLKEWKITTDPDKLVELVNFKKKLYEKTKSERLWINMCLSNPTLQNFLEHTVLLLKKDLVASNISYMRFLLCHLLDPHIYAVQHFPSSSFIMQWIFRSENDQPQDISITQLADFISILQQMKTSIKAAVSAAAAAIEEGKANTVSDLSLAFSSLLKVLRESSQEDLALLLLTIAHSAGYHVENNMFQCLLGIPEIDFMLMEMQEAHEKYLALCEKDAYRAQAYVILTGLRISVDHKDVSPDEKNKCLAFMMNYMKKTLTNETAAVLRKHNTCNNWNLLERDLAHLVNGNYEATNYDQQNENILRELKSIFYETNQSGNSECKDMDSDQDKSWSNNLNNEFLNLMKRLRLEQYYPNKMKISDFHLIQKTSLINGQPSTDQELPSYFLEKILMLDYCARYVACKDNPSVQQGEINISDASKHLDDLDYIFGDTSEGCNEVIQSIQKSIHPMDVQMAIFYCADDFMRQYIATKLSFCQFALPFLVPIPCTSLTELPLWSFCQVHKQWQEKGSKCADKLIYQVATPIVSFIRFSTSSSSKSQLLNNLLSKQKHNIFFHRHCKGSNKNSILMKGVVEIAWYCPGGKENDVFDTCIAFTNLHGDSKEHKQQVDFLQEIASVTVILLSENDLKGDSKFFLTELLKSPKPFIFLCTDKEQIAPNKDARRVKIAVKNRNEAALIEELAQEIKSALNISVACQSIETCAVIARKYGFFVDEDKEECKTGKTMAENIVNILQDEHVLKKKSTLLPLQGLLWHMWCQKDREQNHLQDHENVGLEQQISQINSAKQRIKQDQLNQAFPLSDLMKSLLTHLHSSSHNIKIYFLQWLKTFMASQSSDHLAVRQEKYHDLWTQKLLGENSDLHSKLEELSKEISESTFGLEHLLREVIQLYEVLPQENQVVQFLPQIAADLIVSGYPMELMDGDASHVPIKWISAIFDTLAEKLGDKKVFVLCVLGNQSTGKSTLLNAMFGLQFSVSPGRCTKGAFMQLVEVADELRPELNFDFLLVVDTEGLQATKLENRATLNHDNELATFVIGLGNMTVINTFGENPSEMQDVLQIVVQAFLRMKKVNLSPSCLFVHQNAGEITTEEKNRESRRCLQQNLDEMTVTAAQQESCDVSCFSDVIQFDVNSHVYYFPHLWEGEPPMAPPNPSYSQKVQELKSKILLDGVKKSQQGLLRLSELKIRIQNLWEALLNETFVFSFKNTLEIAAYSRLENKYSNWTWQLRSFMLDYGQKLTIQIQNGKVHDIDRSSLEERIQITYEAVKVDLEKYFKEDKNSNLIIQWKENIKIKLELLKQDLINKTCQNCEKLINLKKRQRRFEQRKSVYIDELLKKSKEVAQRCRDRKLNESELREYFNGMWKEWIAELTLPVSHIKTFNIRADMEHFLSEYFRSEHDIRNRIKESFKWASFPAEASYHIWFKKLKAIFQKNEIPSEDLNKLTRNLEMLICEYIMKREEEIMSYSSSYFHEIVKIINEKILYFEENTHLRSTSSYRVDVSLYLCQMAAQKFTKLYEIFQKETDPIIYLNSKKEDFFKSFAISYQGEKSVTTFADFLCSSLKLAIRDAIYEKTAIDIVNEMKSEDPAFNGNRQNLEIELLIHLAKKENFDKYMDYIYNPSYSMAEFIQQRVSNYCLDKRNPKLKKFLHSHFDVFKDLILCAINDSTRVVEDKGGNVSLWLDEFCSRVGDNLYLPRHTLSSIEHQEVIGIKLIKEAVTDSLVSVLNDLKRVFSEPDFDPFFAKPHEILFEQLSGCMKQCPFCKAVCTNTIPDHDGEHSTYFHRPQAVTGVQWEGTKQFVTDICSSIVRSDSTFTFDGKKIPCKQYREAGSNYAKWNIQPNMFTQFYWKWFVCHFRSELEDTYNGVFEGKGKIPHDWEYISTNEISHHMRRVNAILNYFLNQDTFTQAVWKKILMQLIGPQVSA